MINYEMKNIPRIFIDFDLKPEIIVPISRDVSHYLLHVMRCSGCLVFNNGIEYNAHISDDGKVLKIGSKTSHADPSNDIVVYFSPIKKLDDMINMATQLGVARFIPVITEHTVAKHINWDRMRKIAIEASEQSNRNSVPIIENPRNFSELDLTDMFFADERCAYGYGNGKITKKITKIFIGPEGGFSETEFKSFDDAGAVGISLGKTILRAELAAIVAITRIL